jgi:chromosomal replication initiator protein
MVLRRGLLSRLKWGLLAEMTMPDYETRYYYSRKERCMPMASFLPKDVVEYVAFNINTNVTRLRRRYDSPISSSFAGKEEMST